MSRECVGLAEGIDENVVDIKFCFHLLNSFIFPFISLFVSPCFAAAASQRASLVLLLFSCPQPLMEKNKEVAFF